MVTASSPVVSIRYDTTAVQGGALGIFFDPCPTGDLLGGAQSIMVYLGGFSIRG